MEVALVVGAVLLVATLLQLRTVESALGSLALFLTAATRVMPSMLRLNGVPDHVAVPRTARRLRLHDGEPHPGAHDIGHAS